MRGRLPGQHVGLLTRSCNTEHCNHCGFAGRLVLAGALAGFLGAALGVQQIIGDLERRAQVPPVGREQVPLHRGSPARGWRRPRH